MTEEEMIRQKRKELSRDAWVVMMQKRKAMQSEGKTTQAIIDALAQPKG